MKKRHLIKQIILLLALIGIVSAPAFAERAHRRDVRADRHEKAERHPEGYRLDSRYRHNHYYPAIGYHSNRLPVRHYVIRYHDRPYFYSGGIWYGLSGGLYVVIRAPFGAVVPVLPPYYTTIWAGGIPYYYANDVYYTWQPDRSGYVVTSPPADISEQKVTPLSEQLYIYPKQGQSEKQQADDRYACHTWGVKQSGYDPSQPPSATPEALASKREDYQRAMKACLEGRGYSVK